MLTLDDAQWRAMQQALAALGVQATLEPATQADAALPVAATTGLHPDVGQAVVLADGRRLHLARSAPLLAWQMLAEHSQDLLLALDADLRIALASPAAERRLGTGGGSLRGRTLAELIDPDDRADFIARHFTRAARGARGPGLCRLLADSGPVWVQARVLPLPAGHAVGRYLVTLIDADERKRSEDQHRDAQDRLVALAATDALTGLPNRRQFDLALQKEWLRAQRERVPLALLMIDLDRFKTLNDRFGHPVGDAVLARAAQALAGELRRAGDLPARYGGEEFAAILPGTGSAGAREIGEHVRAAIERLPLDGIAPGLGSVTASIGAAARLPRPDLQPADLLAAADSALYRAKSGGRNRVVADDGD